MKYYKLGQDQRIPYGVLLTNINAIDGYYESKNGNLSALERVIASYVNSSPVNFYPDILDRQIFMIKGAVKEVFDLFLSDIQYKHCILIDRPEKRHEQYYIPILDVCSVNEGSGQGKHIFRISDTKEIEVAASLEAIEAILRRKPTGVRITAI